MVRAQGLSDHRAPDRCRPGEITIADLLTHDLIRTVEPGSDPDPDRDRSEQSQQPEPSAAQPRLSPHPNHQQPRRNLAVAAGAFITASSLVTTAVVFGRVAPVAGPPGSDNLAPAQVPPPWLDGSPGSPLEPPVRTQVAAPPTHPAANPFHSWEAPRHEPTGDTPLAVLAPPSRSTVTIPVEATPATGKDHVSTSRASKREHRLDRGSRSGDNHDTQPAKPSRSIGAFDLGETLADSSVSAGDTVRSIVPSASRSIGPLVPVL